MQFERETGFMDLLSGIPNVSQVQERVFFTVLVRNNIQNERNRRPERTMCGFSMRYFPKGMVIQHASRLISSRGRAPIGRWTATLTKALVEMHRRGVVHGDIKTDNVLVSGKGAVYFTDFGSSMTKEEIERARMAGTLSAALGYVGTFETCPPELLACDATVFNGEALDVWCMGLLVFELCNGTLPYDMFLRGSRCPFCSHDEKKKKSKAHRTNVAISNAHIRCERCMHAFFKSDFSKEFYRLVPDPLASDFIRIACQLSAQDRPSAETLAQHPFCSRRRSLRIQEKQKQKDIQYSTR